MTLTEAATAPLARVRCLRRETPQGQDMSDQIPDPDGLRNTVARLCHELDQLRARLDELDRRADAIYGQVNRSPSPAPPPVISKTAPPPEEKPVPPAPARHADDSARIFAEATQSPPYAVTAARPEPQQEGVFTKSPRPTGAMEVAIGKTWLNRIGALILLLGVGFFVKYSFDQGWIQPCKKTEFQRRSLASPKLLNLFNGGAVLVCSLAERRLKSPEVLRNRRIDACHFIL